MDEVVDLDGGGARVFEKAGHDALIVGADRDEAVGAGEFGSEIAPGEDEESTGGEGCVDDAKELANGLKGWEVGEGVAHADDDVSHFGDMVGEIEDVGVMDVDGEGADVGGQFGKELGAGIKGVDLAKGELGEREGLESGAAAEVDGEAARCVFEEGFEEGALFGDFLIEGEAEHPGVVAGEEVGVVGGDGVRHLGLV